MTKSAIAFLASTALFSGAVLAQTAAPTPAGTMPAPRAPAQFLTDQSVGQFRASKFVGLDVYGTDNQKIGDINEILVDKSGNAVAAVIGIGGFLGIGEKNVAVAFSSLEWMNTRPTTTTASAVTSPGPMTASMATTGTNPATRVMDTTASTATVPERSPDESAAYNGVPDHAMLRLSKADLESAPQFKYYADTHARTTAPSNATTTPMTTAPKP